MVVSEERMAALEARTARLEARMTRLDAQRAAWSASPPSAPPERPAGAPGRIAQRSDAGEPEATSGTAEQSIAPPSGTATRSVAPPPPAAIRPAVAPAPAPAPAGIAASAPRVEDLLGGRALAWVGGIAVLLGLVFFLAVAASRGWIGEEARVLMAAVASLALLAGGGRLHERRGRNEAALAAAATGIAGLFATIVVAGPVYDLLPAAAALPLALAAGAVATGLALRWEAPGIGWLGIVGALLGPALVGADDGTGIALMLVAYAAAGAVMIWQRWHALAGAAFAIALLQLAGWVVDRTPSPAAALGALCVFGAVTAVGATGFEWRLRAPRMRVSALVLLALNAFALAVLGAVALALAGLRDAGLDGEGGISLWLAGLAVVHLGAGLIARRGKRVSRELTLALAGLGIILADVAFASVVEGLPLVLGWAAGGVAFAALTRAARHRADTAVALAGLGGHVLLAATVAVTGAIPLWVSGVGASDEATAVGALAVLVAGAWAAARLVEPRFPRLRLAFDGGALAALAFLSATALDGVGLTLALAGESAALAMLAARDRRRAQAAPEQRIDALPFPAACAFAGAVLLHGLAVLAPPGVLVAGLDPVLPAVAGLAAVVGATVVLARCAGSDAERLALGSAAAIVALYALSALVVTPFQPGGDAAGLPLAELDVRQQGQALLSAVWALAGVIGLVAGLVRDHRVLRLAALGLLTLTVAKVFAFDLASLTSLYRVGSCIVLGLLLLVGAFAWQRIRPRPLPDLRGVPGALR